MRQILIIAGIVLASTITGGLIGSQLTFNVASYNTGQSVFEIPATINQLDIIPITRSSLKNMPPGYNYKISNIGRYKMIYPDKYESLFTENTYEDLLKLAWSSYEEGVKKKSEKW